jgi:hypothetical protein
MSIPLKSFVCVAGALRLGFLKFDDAARENTMPAKGNVPHDDYQLGFEVGYQAVAGMVPTIPVSPAEPVTIKDYTPFLMGVRAGVRTAGGNVKG